MKYTDYLKKSGMSNNDVIAILQPHFPKFTKIQCSMLSHPEDYGIELSAKARKLLPPLPSKPKPKRTKPNRVVVYLNDEQYARLMGAKGEASTQQFIETILKEKSEEGEHR